VVARKTRWRSLLLAAAVGIALYAFFGGDDGLYQVWKMRRELTRIEGEVARLEAENDSLRQVLWRLENDLEYVEKVAREEYGMSKKGERVYRLRPPVESEEE